MARFISLLMAGALLWLGGMAGPGEARETLNTLTINLMGAYGGSDWDNRANRLTDFLVQQEAVDPVDLVLIQEGYGGLWSRIINGADDTIVDLQNRLAKKGLTYQAHSIFCFWETQPYSYYKIGLLSKYPIIDRAEITITAGADSRQAPACAIQVPDLGVVAVSSVHLSAGVPESALVPEAQAVAALMEQVAAARQARLSLIGGDFNTIYSPASPVHAYMTSQGYVDTFLAVNPGAGGATFRVPGNPYAATTGDPVRIDYIFVKGEDVTVEKSRVVLDGQTGPFVSDHSGVLSRVRLAGTPPPVEPLEVSLDIKPGQCPNTLNMKKETQLTVALCGTANFDPGLVRPDTLSLRREGSDGRAAPQSFSLTDAATAFPKSDPCSCTAARKDGRRDLVLKFSVAGLRSALQLDQVVNQPAVFTLSGALEDGTPVRGEDCLKPLLGNR